MALLSSKTLIQAHALFTFILAVYLVTSPSAITESDIIFIIGEAMQIVINTAIKQTNYMNLQADDKYIGSRPGNDNNPIPSSHLRHFIYR